LFLTYNIYLIYSSDLDCEWQQLCFDACRNNFVLKCMIDVCDHVTTVGCRQYPAVQRSSVCWQWQWWTTSYV